MHPTKIEVRFRDSREVHQTVRKAVEASHLSRAQTLSTRWPPRGRDIGTDHGWQTQPRHGYRFGHVHAHAGRRHRPHPAADDTRSIGPALGAPVVADAALSQRWAGWPGGRAIARRCAESQNQPAGRWLRPRCAHAGRAGARTHQHGELGQRGAIGVAPVAIGVAIGDAVGDTSQRRRSSRCPMTGPGPCCGANWRHLRTGRKRQGPDHCGHARRARTCGVRAPEGPVGARTAGKPALLIPLVFAATPQEMATAETQRDTLLSLGLDLDAIGPSKLACAPPSGLTQAGRH